MTTFTALYDNRAEAERAQAELARLGISSGDVTIHDQNSAGLGTGDGSSDGGFFSSLRDMFVPDDDSQAYGEGLRRGHFLLTVRTDSQHADRVHEVLERSSAVDLDDRTSSWRNEGWTGGSSSMGSRQGLASGSAMGSEQVIPVVEEQLAVGKREVARGGVRVRSYVKEIPVHEQVSLREEHVDVERRAVNEPLRAGDLDNAFQERTIEVTETAEEAVVAKNARVVEEVVVGKDVSERVETIDDTVRRTEVDVDRVGGTDTERGAFFDKDRGPNR